jgi:hypothetical protein
VKNIKNIINVLAFTLDQMCKIDDIVREWI